MGVFSAVEHIFNETVMQGLENSKSEASSESVQTCTTDISGTMVGIVMNGTAGVLMSGMMTGVLLDGTKVGHFPQAHFHLEVRSSPKRFEWVKMSLDTGAAVNTFPLNFGPDGAGDGRFYRTASR